MKKLILCAAILTQSLFAFNASADAYPKHYTLWQNGKLIVIFLQQAAYGTESETLALPVCPDMIEAAGDSAAIPSIVQDETGFCVEFKAAQI